MQEHARTEHALPGAKATEHGGNDPEDHDTASIPFPSVRGAFASGRLTGAVRVPCRKYAAKRNVEQLPRRN
jgi:hypothetical protein